MRTSPLPNRHAFALGLFTEGLQTTLNRNRGKLPLDEIGILRLLLKLSEELLELVLAICHQSIRKALRASTDFTRVEMEALDVGVVLLGLWMWTRKERGE